MIHPIIANINNNNVAFGSGDSAEPKKKYAKDTLLKNNLSTRARIGFDKLTNACTLYPAKGLKGSKNSNFYEFLTMGTVPYLVGSGMMMAVFNSANKYFGHYDSAKAAMGVGKKMALGVLLYGVAKSLSKSLITTPVKMATGVDTEVPYAKVNYELPDNINDTDITSIEYHKAFESVEFPRWDLFYGDTTKGQSYLGYYDKVAKKMGLGENLPSSDKEVKPRIKEIVTKSNAVKNITSYLWAGVAVCLAFQKPWEDFFNVATMKFWKGKDFAKSAKTFGKSFVNSAKDLWTGGLNATKGVKIAGKALILTALFATLAGNMHIINSSKKPSKLDASDVIEKNRKYVVS